MPSVGFEPTIPARELPQTYVLDRAATGAGIIVTAFKYFTFFCNSLLTNYVIVNIMLSLLLAAAFN